MRRSVLIVAAAGCVCAGTALATANTILLRVPKDATVNQAYSLGLRGHATTRERLYLFVDYKKCGRNPAIEHSRTNGVVWMVKGSFNEVSRGWRSSGAGTDHSCGYLQKASEPEDAAGGILARAAHRYTIH